MRLEELQKEMISAMKNKDKLRKMVLSEIIDMTKKSAMGKNGRSEITETMVNEAIIKYKKTVQEMIDTCPPSLTSTLENYNEQMAIVDEFAPKIVSDENEIRNLILGIVGEIEFTKTNKGQIMKTVMPALKGKVDMAVTNKVLGGMFNG